MVDALQEYRREAEKQYGLVIVNLIHRGQKNLKAEELCQTGLSQPQRQVLDNLANRLSGSTKESLSKGKWYDANEETRRCLAKASGQQQRDPQLIDVSLINVVDLQTIDALWSEFSNGRFGFKKQREIWEKADSRFEDLTALGRQLDWLRSNSWINYEAADFSKDAVSGHLPIFPHIGW